MFGFGGARGFQLGVVLEAKNLLKAEMRRVKGDTDEAKRKLAGLQGQLRQLERYSRGMKIGAGITAIGASLSYASAKVWDANKQIEESLAGVGTVAADTYAEWLAMEDKARERVEELAIAHRGSVGDISEGMYEMLSSGIAYDTVAEGMDHVIEGNLAMRGELQQTSKLFGTVYNNFSDQLERFDTDAEKLGHVADVFAYSTKKYQMTGPLISEAFSYAVAPAKEWGMELEEVVAILGLLHNRGIQGSMSGTALLGTHRGLLKAEKELGIEFKRNADGSYSFANVLEALHEKYGDNIADNDELKRKLQDAFGDEGKKAIIALWGMEDALRGDSGAMKEVAGAARDMAQAFEKTSGAKLERLADQWDILKASLAEDNEVVDWAIGALSDLMGVLKDAPDWVKTAVGGGMAVTGAAGSMFGPLMTGYSALMMYRTAKGVKGLAGAGGLGGAMPVYETNPAAMGGAGAAGAAGKAGVVGTVARYAGPAALGAAAGYGILKGEDVAVSAAQKKIWGKEYIAGPWEGLKLMGEAAATTSKGWNPLAGEWGDWSKWGDVWKAATGKYEEVKEKKRVEEVSKTENFNININTINTQATDGAQLAGELKKQARRTGKRTSP